MPVWTESDQVSETVLYQQWVTDPTTTQNYFQKYSYYFWQGGPCGLCNLTFAKQLWNSSPTCHLLSWWFLARLILQT